MANGETGQGPADERSTEGLEHGLDGEVYRTLTGGLRGVYTLAADVRPPVAELQRAVARRFGADRPRLRRPGGEIRLTDWFGGWTPEGRGIFEAEVEQAVAPDRWRRVGRVRVVVRATDRARRWASLLGAA